MEGSLFIGRTFTSPIHANDLFYALEASQEKGDVTYIGHHALENRDGILTQK